jgi:hypothetical protein
MRQAKTERFLSELEGGGGKRRRRLDNRCTDGQHQWHRRPIRREFPTTATPKSGDFNLTTAREETDIAGVHPPHQPPGCLRRPPLLAMSVV